MKATFVFLAAILYACDVTAQAGNVFVGVLEEPQCKDDKSPAVRPLFVKHGERWSTLDAPKFAEPILGGFDNTWTVTFDGRRIGVISSYPPAKRISPIWAYSRDYLQSLRSDVRGLQVLNKSKSFGGWCDVPTYRPLVLVSEPHHSDPEHWKPFRVDSAIREKLLEPFRKTLKNSPPCVLSNDKPVPITGYGTRNLSVQKSYRSLNGNMILSVSLDREYIDCNSDLGWPETARWFWVTSHEVRYMGNELTLIDAGDYDNDGKSELVFWHSGYNEDGYVLYYQDASSRANYYWKYH